jgi:hypothetical protein
VNSVINSQGVTAMSDNFANQPATSADPAFSEVEINWPSLWQASGNDWSWMLQSEKVTEESLPPRSKSASNRRPTCGEIFFTSILVLSVLWLQTCTDSGKTVKQPEVALPAISLDRVR